MEYQAKQPPQSQLPGLQTPDPSWDYADLWNHLENAIHYLLVTKSIIAQEDDGNQNTDNVIASRLNESISHILYIKMMGE